MLVVDGQVVYLPVFSPLAHLNDLHELEDRRGRHQADEREDYDAAGGKEKYEEYLREANNTQTVVTGPARPAADLPPGALVASN